MQERQSNLFTRDDTFFGVCQGLGEDFGFNPNFLRVALGVLLLFNPVAVIVGYVAAGVLVAFSRLVVREPRRAAAAAGAPAAAPAEGNDNAEIELAAAA